MVLGNASISLRPAKNMSRGGCSRAIRGQNWVAPRKALRIRVWSGLFVKTGASRASGIRRDMLARGLAAATVSGVALASAPYGRATHPLEVVEIGHGSLRIVFNIFDILMRGFPSGAKADRQAFLCAMCLRSDLDQRGPEAAWRSTGGIHPKRIAAMTPP